jgi:hypothetical protein
MVNWRRAEEPAPTGTLIASAWCHAAQLHNIFLRAGVPNSDLEKNIGGALTNMPKLLAAHPAGLFDDVAYGARVDWAVFLVRGIGGILRVLPEVHARSLHISAELVRRAIAPNDDSVGPIIMLAQETENRLNTVSSFLGGLWRAPLESALSSETIAEWFPGSPDTIALAQLATVETTLETNLDSASLRRRRSAFR